MAFALSPKQEELRDAAASPARHILAYGGSRSGKTFGFCYCVAVRGLCAPGSRHLIARLRNIDVRQSVMIDTWPKMMQVAFPAVDYEIRKADQFIELPGGSEVWFAGLDDPARVDKILGKEFATVYMNEASQLAYDTVLTVRTRLAQGCTKLNGKPLALKEYVDLNPVGRGHWTYREWIDGVSPVTQAPLPEGTRAHVTINPGDNPHLPAEYLEILAGLPERQRRRFSEGVYQSEVEGALWPLERMDASRVPAAPDLTRVVIGVDPSGSDGVGGDCQGIVVVGLGVDGHAYVLEDASCKLSSAQWGHRVAMKWREWGADLVVAEGNYGGDMVASTIRRIDESVNVKMVHATRGKAVRAEPIAALYETTPGRPAMVHHVGRLPELEDQMAMMTTAGFQGAGSPDRVDALVWALTELMLKEQRSFNWYVGA